MDKQEAIAQRLLEHLGPREVLEIINYRPETILVQDSTIKAFCPIHGELVFRTLIIDGATKEFRCSYSLCPGNAGGDVIDLFAMVRKIDRDEAVEALLTHVPESIEISTDEEIEQTAEPEPAPAVAEQKAEEPPSEAPAPEESAPEQIEPEPESPAPAEDPPKRDLLVDAESLMESEQWIQAEQLLTNLLAAEPRNLRGLIARSRCLERLEQGEQATGLYPTIIDAALARSEIKTAQAFFRRLCERSLSIPEILGVLDKLIEPCREASTGISPLLEALIARAERSEQADDYEAALALYRAAEPVAPPHLDLQSYITQVLTQMGQTDQAIAIYEQRCEQARSANDFSTALDCLRTMIELDPSRVDFRQMLIETAIEDGLSPQLFEEVLGLVDTWIGDSEFGLAREALDLLAHYLPNEIAIHERLWKIARDQDDQPAARATAMRLAEVCRQGGRAEEAIEYLAALPLDTGTPEHIEMLAQCQFEADRIEQAAETLLTLAHHYDAAGAWASSEPIYARLTLWQPQEPGWVAKQAKCKQQTGDTAEALALHERSGMEFLSLGRLEEAIEVWSEALAIDPAATDIAQMQHNLLHQLKRPDEARQLMSSTVNYLKLNRGPEEAAKFMSGCAGTEEQTVESTLLLADLWGQAENPDEAKTVLGAALEKARENGDVDAQVRLAQRWLAHEPTNTQALEIVAAHGPTASQAHDRRRVLSQLSESYIGHEDWHKAADVIGQLLKDDPEDSRLQERLIGCHERGGDIDAAHRLRFHLAERRFGEQRWTECLELVSALSAEPVVLHLRFRCHVHLEQIDEAAALAETLIGHLIDESDLDAAIAVAEQMADVAQGDTDWRQRLVALLISADREADAVTAARAIIEKTIDAEDREAARAQLDRLLSLAPDCRPLLAAVIEALDGIGEKDTADHERLRLAVLHRAAGDDAPAEEILLALLSADPDNRRARASLIDLLVSTGNSEAAVGLCWDRVHVLLEGEHVAEATEELQRLLEIDPQHLDSRRRLADLLRAQNRTEETVEQLAILAQLLADSGELPDAISTWEEVIELRPEVVPYHQALITCLLSAGGGEDLHAAVERLMRALIAREAHDDALLCLEKFESFDAALPLWHRWRGEVLTSRGETGEALEAYRKYTLLVDKHVSARVGREMGPGGQGSKRGADRIQLVPDYVFDSFIIGDHSSFACATCQAVADNPAEAYNPLFLYSDVGLGKTHLVNAIGNHIRRHHPKLRVLYTSVEEYVAGLIDAIQRNTVNEFRAHHRRVDVFLVDDVQFLAGKERAQEEFFHLFNTLFQAQRQIVVTSDRPPREMTYLEKRLRSRFGAGVIVDMQPPDIETRIAIVRQAAEGAGASDLSDEVIQLIAERCASNVRELKGALMQLVAIATSRETPLTRDEASGVLDQLLESVS